MIRYNEFLTLQEEKFSKKNIIFGSSGRVQVRVEFDPKIYRFFEFGSEKSCSEPKTFERVQVEFSDRVNFCQVYPNWELGEIKWCCNVWFHVMCLNFIGAYHYLKLIPTQYGIRKFNELHSTLKISKSGCRH